MKPVPHGEPYAGKLHVRFDEGYPPKNGEARFEGSRRPSGRSPRGVPLYSTPSLFSLQLYALLFYAARCKHSALRALCSQRFTPASVSNRPTVMHEAS